MALQTATSSHHPMQSIELQTVEKMTVSKSSAICPNGSGAGCIPEASAKMRYLLI
jgi:hypothetical protein